MQSDCHWESLPEGRGISHPGSVHIGSNGPQHAFATPASNVTLNVAGGISVTGGLYRPSDQRLKENIREVNPVMANNR